MADVPKHKWWTNPPSPCCGSTQWSLQIDGKCNVCQTESEWNTLLDRLIEHVQKKKHAGK